MSAGTLLVNGTQTAAASKVMVRNSRTLLGGGGIIVGAVSLTAGAAITAATRGAAGRVVAANVGTLKTGALTLDSTAAFHFDVLDATATAGSGYDQVGVTGTVTLGDSILEGSIASGLNLEGATLILIDNDGGDAIIGTFAGITQGSTVSLNGYSFTASYTGGTGNDIVLTGAAAVPEPATWAAGLGCLGLAAASLRRLQIFRTLSR